MEKKILVEMSARHVHVTQADLETLFGKGATLTPKRELSQPGQYLAKERITIAGPRGTFENVAILGPFRKETQVELSLTDTRKIGVPGVIRQSGDIKDTPGCKLIAGDQELEIDKGVIVAKRHIHMTPGDAIKMRLKDNEEVFVITQSFDRALIYANVVVRISWDYQLSMHVDTDEANAFAGDAEPHGVVLKLFGGDAYDLGKWADELLEGINRTI